MNTTLYKEISQSIDQNFKNVHNLKEAEKLAFDERRYALLKILEENREQLEPLLLDDLVYSSDEASEQSENSDIITDGMEEGSDDTD